LGPDHTLNDRKVARPLNLAAGHAVQFVSQLEFCYSAAYLKEQRL